jgi:hypothetical protein
MGTQSNMLECILCFLCFTNQAASFHPVSCVEIRIVSFAFRSAALVKGKGQLGIGKSVSSS